MSNALQGTATETVDVPASYSCAACGATREVIVLGVVVEPLRASDVEGYARIANARWVLATQVEARGGAPAGPPPDPEAELAALHRVGVLERAVPDALKFATCPACGARNPEGAPKATDVAAGVGLLAIVMLAGSALMWAWPPLVWFFLVAQTFGVMGVMVTGGPKHAMPGVIFLMTCVAVAVAGLGWLVPWLQFAAGAVDYGRRLRDPSPQWEETAGRLRFTPSDAG